MSEPDIERDGGPFSVKEALAALDYHMAIAERASGQWPMSLHADLTKIAELIERLETDRDELRSAGGDIVRKLLASRESLSREPT